MSKIFTFLIVILSFQSAYSDCTSNGTGGGQWDQASSWSCHPESAPPTNPSCPTTITILATDSIYIDSQTDLVSCGPITVIVYGQIKFKNGVKLKLADGSTLELDTDATMYPGSGGGNSNYLEIGGNTVWNADSGTVSGPRTYGSSGILPVKLVSFEANTNDDKVDLKWITAAEVNNDFFTIEKSKDAKSWEVLNVVSGAGNSNVFIEYFDSDYSPFKGVSYYRLKQTDFDGNYSYSSIVPVKYVRNNIDGSISLFPNPVRRGEEVKISFDDIFEEKILVVLRDTKGQEFFSKVILNIEDGVLTAIPIDYSLNSGVYLVTASSENQMYSQKLLVK